MKFGITVAVAGALGAFVVATVALIVAADASNSEGVTRVEAQTVAVEEGEFFIR